jgi:hypothetical protein
MNVPNSQYTSVYGPDYDSTSGIYNFVGSYVDQTTHTKGFLYTGKLNQCQLDNKKNYNYPSVNNIYDITFLHSISNDVLVGNAGNIGESNTFSFLYKTNDLNNLTEIKYPGSETTTTYGIWYNTYNNKYTIVGGYSPKKIPINKIYDGGIILPIGKAFVVDYNLDTNTFENWTDLQLPLNTDTLSRIQGISSFFDYDGAYSICIDTINNSRNFGYYATIIRDDTFGFVITKFIEVKYDTNGLSSVNSVANNNVVGLYVSKLNQAFQATILG